VPVGAGKHSPRRGARLSPSDLSANRVQQSASFGREEAAAWPEWCSSSIGEESSGLGLVPALTMRATAVECLLPVTSQAIRKHLRDRGVGAGIAPKRIARRNSELVGIRRLGPTTRSVSRLARSRTRRGSDDWLCFGLAAGSSGRSCWAAIFSTAEAAMWRVPGVALRPQRTEIYRWAMSSVRICSIRLKKIR
jgi:hypothetical protein